MFEILYVYILFLCSNFFPQKICIVISLFIFFLSLSAFFKFIFILFFLFYFFSLCFFLLFFVAFGLPAYLNIKVEGL